MRRVARASAERVAHSEAIIVPFVDALRVTSDAETSASCVMEPACRVRGVRIFALVGVCVRDKKEVRRRTVNKAVVQLCGSQEL